jgi:hypothetical protein
MKKLLFMALPVVFSGVALALPACPTQATAVSLATLEGLNATGGCEVGDKIFSAFNGTDTVDSLYMVGPTGSLTSPLYQINLNAGGNGTLFGPVSFGFTLTIDATSPLNTGFTAAITRVSAGIQDVNSGASSGTVTKTVNGSACAVYTEANGTPTVNTTCNPNASSIVVAEAFTYTGTVGESTISGFGDSFTQTLTPTNATPEPVSMLLFGTGLLACGFIGRKRAARR